VSLLKRDKLAERFAEMNTNQQRTWVIKAADVLHRSNAIDSYGPPIGELLMREALQAEDAATAARPEAEGHSPAADHAHGQGLYTQVLPACLAPTDADRAAQPDLALPGKGDAVVIANGHVMFLTAVDGTELIAPDSNQLWAVPTVGEGCGAARWDPDNVVEVDLSYMILPAGDVEAIETAWTLLIDLAAQHEAGGWSR